MTAFKVVISDQVFPTVDIEREILSGIGAHLVVATGDVEAVLAVAADTSFGRDASPRRIDRTL